MIWSKNAFIIKAGFSLTAFFVACGGDSSSKAEPSDVVLREVATIYDLGACTADRYGDTVFVYDKAVDYLCVNNDWLDITTPPDNPVPLDNLTPSDDPAPSDNQSEESESRLSSFIDEDILSSSSFADNLIRSDSNSTTPSQTTEDDYIIVPSKEKLPACGSDNVKQNVLVQTDSILYTCTLKNWEPNDPKGYIVKDAAIVGTAQKGPFIVKSPLMLSEVLLRNDSIVYSGRKYSGEISGEKGNFEISKVDLIYPYAVLEVRGQWRNEISGFFSKDSITLRVLTDLSKRTEVNINLLTHLEYDRAAKLISTGRYNVYVAKTQADYEIMKAFGFTTSVECSEDLITFVSTSNASHDANAALMAISLLFIADKNDADILKSINDFKSDLAEDGSWDNEQMKVNMADWAESFDGGSVRANVNAWGVLDVPKYEDFLTIFWNNAYGLGECDQARYGVVLPVSNKLSKNYENHYICKEYGWRKATVLEYDTYGKTCMTDGSIVDGAIISVNKYVCDAGKFRELSEMEKSLGKACVSYTENDEIRKRISVLSDSVYTCQNGLWIAEYVEEEDLLLDKRDSKVYRTVSIGNQIWMAENLDYSDSSVYIGMKKRSWCYKNSADSCAKYGRYYAWAAAMDSAGIFTSEGNGCGYGKGCFSTNVIRGICPEGWHLPSRTEWQTLYSAMNLSPNAMQAKGFEIWPNATDAYAFSAYPAGYTNVGNVRRFGEYAGFWTAYDYDNSEAFYWVVGTNEAYISTDHKYNGYSVRCVKD